MPLPSEIAGLLRSRITVTWQDGHQSVFPARDLRLACRCAACIEEMSGRPILDAASVPERVQAKRIELIGQYAVAIEWSDGHGSGIYNFRDLRAACPCDACAAERAEGRQPA